MFLSFLKVSFPQYEKRVDFADIFWNETHISAQTLTYAETDFETGRKRRRRFPYRVIESIYDDFPKHTHIEKRGKRKSEFSDSGQPLKKRKVTLKKPILVSPTKTTLNVNSEESSSDETLLLKK